MCIVMQLVFCDRGNVQPCVPHAEGQVAWLWDSSSSVSCRTFCALLAQRVHSTLTRRQHAAVQLAHLLMRAHPMPCRNASVLTASLLWRDPTSKALDGSSGSGDSLRSEALSLLEGMAAGLQVTILVSQHCQDTTQCDRHHALHPIYLA